MEGGRGMSRELRNTDQELGVGVKACMFEVCFITGASVLRFESFLTMPVNAF